MRHGRLWESASHERTEPSTLTVEFREFAPSQEQRQRLITDYPDYPDLPGLLRVAVGIPVPATHQNKSTL
jgi:hypothetical protein